MNRQMMKRSLLASLIGIALIHGNTSAQPTLDTSSLIQDSRSLLSLVVSVDDRVMYAQSFNGHEMDELFNHQSLTKNVMALLVGIAIDKGYIDSLSVKIVDFLPALNDDPDERKRQITLRDVMNQASGLWHEDLAHLRKYLRLKDPSSYVLHQPLVAAPGSTLHYNNAASHLMSVILSEATGQTTFDFAQKYLFGPLGIDEVTWPVMRDGHHDGSGLLSVRMRTADMNKIGRLILEGGEFEGERVVSEEWTALLLRPEKVYPAPWELLNTTYGLTFYHRNYRGMPVTFGMGWGGQFLILIPDLHAVISVNQRVNDRTAVRQSDVFMSQIFPVIVDWIVSSRL